MTDKKLNTAPSDVKGAGCPSWCVSRHDYVQDPEPCWSEDRAITLTLEQEPSTNFEDDAQLHIYLERAGSGASQLVIYADEVGPLTVDQAKQLIKHLEHLVYAAAAE